MLDYCPKVIFDLCLTQENIGQSQKIYGLSAFWLYELGKNILNELDMNSDLGISLSAWLHAVCFEPIERQVDDVDETCEVFLTKLWLVCLTELSESIG